MNSTNDAAYDAAYNEALAELSQAQLFCWDCTRQITTDDFTIVFVADEDDGGYVQMCAKCGEAHNRPPSWCETTYQPVDDNELPF